MKKLFLKLLTVAVLINAVNFNNPSCSMENINEIQEEVISFKSIAKSYDEFIYKLNLDGIEKMAVKFRNNLKHTDVLQYILSNHNEDCNKNDCEVHSINSLVTNVYNKYDLHNLLKKNPKLSNALLNIVNKNYDNSDCIKKIRRNINELVLLSELDYHSSPYEIYYDFCSRCYRENNKENNQKLEEKFNDFCKCVFINMKLKTIFDFDIKYDIKDELFAISEMLFQDGVKKQLLSLDKEKEISLEKISEIANDKKYDNVHSIDSIRKHINNILLYKELGMDSTFYGIYDTYFKYSKENNQEETQKQINIFFKYLLGEDGNNFKKIFGSEHGNEFEVAIIYYMLQQDEVKNYLIDLLVEDNKLCKNLLQIFNNNNDDHYLENYNDENYSNQVSKMIESIHDKHFNIFIEVLAPSTFTPNNILIGKKIKDCIKLAEKRKKSNCCIY